MKKTSILTTLIWIVAFAAKAQFTAQGKIEFERKSNIHRQFEDMAEGQDNGGWFEKMKAQIPKFNVSYFDYYFTPTESYYHPGKEVENPFKMFGASPGAANEIYTDFNKKKVIGFKQVFEQKYLIQDSMRVLEWKIEDEVRTIANFKCRKAVGKICDSVYVVAFYTDDILVSGGPEMFSGLPGMILEIAIPRLYTTWIATKVEIYTPTATDLKIPEKGKKVTQKEMYTELMSSIGKWGKWAGRSVWWSVL
jgi:GLPGLI family protein